MYRRVQFPWVPFVLLGAGLGSAENPFAKTPFHWFLTSSELKYRRPKARQVGLQVQAYSIQACSWWFLHADQKRSSMGLAEEVVMVPKNVLNWFSVHFLKEERVYQIQGFWGIFPNFSGRIDTKANLRVRVWWWHKLVQDRDPAPSLPKVAQEHLGMDIPALSWSHICTSMSVCSGARGPDRSFAGKLVRSNDPPGPDACGIFGCSLVPEDW